jgi:hypothetical protein
VRPTEAPMPGAGDPSRVPPGVNSLGDMGGSVEEPANQGSTSGGTSDELWLALS